MLADFVQELASFEHIEGLPGIIVGFVYTIPWVLNVDGLANSYKSSVGIMFKMLNETIIEQFS